MVYLIVQVSTPIRSDQILPYQVITSQRNFTFVTFVKPEKFHVFHIRIRSRLSHQRNFKFFTSELYHVCHIREISRLHVCHTREISYFSHQNYITFVTSEKYHVCHIRIISRLSHHPFSNMFFKSSKICKQT